MKSVKTSEAEFGIFQNYFMEYQKEFGLNNYNAYFYHKRLKNAYASTVIDCDSYVVSVYFSKYWDGRAPTSDQLKKCALHECLHLLLGKLEWLGRCRYLDDAEIPGEDESLVVRLTNIISNKEKNEN